VIAHDLHPDYLSTRYARERAGDAAIAVQHHHAHVVSAMAEAGLEGPVLGLAWDGTGLGTDGVSWGSELLLADAAGFERLATFRGIPLAGGDAAIREVWRIALALLRDAFEGEIPPELPLFAGLPRERVAGVGRMLEAGVHCPAAHGVGRYFDGVGALGLGRSRSHYEGQVALEWNGVADPRERGAYAFELQREEGAPVRVDLRPLVRGVVSDLLQGTPPALLSARFHETLAAVAEALVRDAARRWGRLPVVLSGGCFQNPLLVERIQARLAGDFRLVLHREVPPGDGGLALGQAVVAAAAASGGAGTCV
jgi:hydrogenase maturation protein HypF